MRLLIFDLDGTLIDSRLDLANAVNATRAHLGMPSLSNERVYSYVGNGAPVLIKRALGPDAAEETLREGLEFFLTYYRAHALDCTTLYPGVSETLRRLSGAGKVLAVLTNKPTRVSQAIVDGLDIGKWFLQVYGGDSFGFKKPHPVGVRALMEQTGVASGDVLVIGDSSVDVQTARNAGVRACGVTYGFQPESLADPAPDYLADRMEDVAGLILNENGDIK